MVEGAADYNTVRDFLISPTSPQDNINDEHAVTTTIKIMDEILDLALGGVKSKQGNISGSPIAEQTLNEGVRGDLSLNLEEGELLPNENRIENAPDSEFPEERDFLIIPVK